METQKQNKSKRNKSKRHYKRKTKRNKSKKNYKRKINKLQGGELTKEQINNLFATDKIEFEIYNQEFSNEDIQKIAEALKSNTSIISLRLESNTIGDASVIILADALKYNSTLRKLYIQKNNIGDVGVIAIADALKINKSLKELYIKENKIGDAGAIAIADALINNSTLEKLLMNYNNIGDNGAKALLDALKTNTSLISLAIHFNHNTSKPYLNKLYKLVDINKKNFDIKALFDPILEPYNVSLSSNNNDKIKEIIMFIKKTLNLKKKYNSNNEKFTRFNDLVKKILISYSYFKSLISNNYNNGVKAIKNIQPINTTQKVFINLHGQTRKHIFKLPDNINIVFLAPIGYITFCRSYNIKSEISMFNEYLKNPSCIINPDIKTIFNQALIYYGGQYCIDLNLSREDIDHVTGIEFIDEANQFSRNIGGIPEYSSGTMSIKLSDLLLDEKNFSPAINYTILCNSCREMDHLQDKMDKYILIFYEQITKLLNIYIMYNNLKPEEKYQNTLDNYVKKCKKSIANFNNNVSLLQIYNNNNNNNNNTKKYAISSREKPEITSNIETLLVFNDKTYSTLNELKTYLIEKQYANAEKKLIFDELFDKFKMIIYVFNNKNTLSSYNIDNINILKFIFKDNYSFLFEYIIYCLLEIDITREKSNKYINDNKSKQSLLKLFINNIPELKDIPEIKFINSENKSLDELSSIIIEIYINDINKYNIENIVKYNKINNNLVERIRTALINNIPITTLNLSSKNFNDLEVIYIADGLKNNTTLTTLNMSGNNIGENGAIEIAKALKTNTSLLSLDMSSNNIGENGAINIAKALETNTSLLALDMSSNNISDRGAIYLAKCLRINKILMELIINNNKIKINKGIVSTIAKELNARASAPRAPLY